MQEARTMVPKVMGLNPGGVMPKTINMAPIAFL